MDKKYIISTMDVNGKEKIRWVGIKTDEGIKFVHLTNQDAIDIEGREDYYKQLHNIDDGEFFNNLVTGNISATKKSIEELTETESKKSIDNSKHEYYQLRLNGAKMNGYNDYGILYIIPHIKIKEVKGKFFTTKEMDIHYNPGLIIAEKVDNHFEDIILGEKIGYDPNGIHHTEIIYDYWSGDINPLNNYSDEELKIELDKGINCFEYTPISDVEVGKFLKEFLKSHQILQQYKSEVEYVKQKNAIKEEISRRRTKKKKEATENEEALTLLRQFEQKKKR